MNLRFGLKYILPFFSGISHKKVHCLFRSKHISTTNLRRNKELKVIQIMSNCIISVRPVSIREPLQTLSKSPFYGHSFCLILIQLFTYCSFPPEMALLYTSLCFQSLTCTYCNLSPCKYILSCFFLLM